MARIEDDVINVDFILKANISLDIERIVSDPIWALVCMQNGLESDVYYPELLHEYLNHYIIRDRILTEMPSTNGPGEITLKEII